MVSKEKQIAELGRQARESFALNLITENDENIDNNSIFEQTHMIESVEIVCDRDDGVDTDHNYCGRFLIECGY